MNMTKKINVNFSSLVGLKAELLRKQTEVNEAKLKTEPISTSSQLNKKRNRKTVAGDTEKNTKETIDPEDIVSHKKSRLMLEAKARLYERLKKSKNNNDKFLVDFKNKMDESDDFVDETINKEYPIEPEENWVEYQDCFGRTRKCLREDLSHMQRKDDIIKQEIMKKNADDKEEEKEQYSTIEEKEPEIEIMRRKWGEQTQKLADKVDIHYQDVLFDEARTHGVGYYAFSQDEEERIKQQKNLATLRKETEKKQKEMKEIRELKERMEQNRLKAARIRQRIRAGLPAEPTEEELGPQESNSTTKPDNIDTKEVDDESAEKIKEKSNGKTHKSITEDNTASEKIISDEDKIKAFGELLGKKNHWHVMSQEEWIHKCRTQRIEEFAPVYNNFKSAGFYNSSQDIDEQSIHKDNKTFDNTENDSQETKYNTKDNTDLELIRTNLEKHEANNDSIVINETVSVARKTDNSKNSLVQDNITNNKDNTKHEVSSNVMESTSNSATNLLNPLQSQGQTTISYPLSYLSSKYSQITYDYAKAHVTMEYELLDAKDIPLPGENTTTESNDNTIPISKQETSRSINEDNIMAGLKYLREKFEESHSK
ncbi:coiled-coil domain-containing protein 174 [Harpegnathos saltator]|uniref:Uncharacterized protein C3orf19-like protein n=1 Tax=Harpegnathos saltator TaxID=610380 RepID=E2BN32_HARSA|nr:coiled-coil domain-containing protein 174 [Harpegnathos saltator]EFN82936.1 Uncharacterized protein C3orf19-like protein [Harpegnathos saltator]